MMPPGDDFWPLIKLCEVNKSLIKAQHPWLLLWGRLMKCWKKCEKSKVQAKKRASVRSRCRTNGKIKSLGHDVLLRDYCIETEKQLTCEGHENRFNESLQRLLFSRYSKVPRHQSKNIAHMFALMHFRLTVNFGGNMKSEIFPDRARESHQQNHIILNW